MKTTVDHIPPVNARYLGFADTIKRADHPPYGSRKPVSWTFVIASVMFCAVFILLILGAAHALPWQS